MKSIQECIEFANTCTVTYLATAEGDQPHVRALGFWFADETGFYFQTGEIKHFVGELRKNPKTEVCFYKHENLIRTMMRVEGAVEFLEDKSLKERVLNDRPFLKQWGLTIDSPQLVIFRIAHGKAHFWTMADNFKEKEMIEF